MGEAIEDTLIVKVGTDVLTTHRHKDGKGAWREELDVKSFERIGAQIVQLGEVVVVTSAGITAGMIEAGTTERPNEDSDMPGLQALASIGLLPLIERWNQAIRGRTVGTLLLTRTELDLQTERKQALETIYALMAADAVPIINENDAIATQEIRFGDNDILAAILSARIRAFPEMFQSVRLVLLSSVDGVYTDPYLPTPQVIPEIKFEEIDQYQHLARGTDSKNSKGGMASKFVAARLAGQNGVDMWIANGRAENAIQRALNGEIGTHFVAKASTNVE